MSKDGKRHKCERKEKQIDWAGKWKEETSTKVKSHFRGKSNSCFQSLEDFLLSSYVPIEYEWNTSG